MTKTCAHCREVKPVDAFFRDARKRDGRQPRCKTCRQEYANPAKAKEASDRFRARHPERVHATERRCRIKRNYGISHDEYEAMVVAQDSRCAICGTFHERLTIDHDHETGAVRALLCPGCNAGLGRFGDDPARLEAALRYLNRFA